MRRKSNLYLEDILEAIERIEEYTENFDFEDFCENSMVIDATVRNLEIIGEASSQLPEQFKAKYKNIPWQEMKDFRNVVAHKYHSVDLEIIWEIIQDRLIPLRESVESVLNKIT